MNPPDSVFSVLPTSETRRLTALLKVDFPNASRLAILQALSLAAASLPDAPTRRRLLRIARTALGGRDTPDRVAAPRPA